jgi:hypothetical protein
MPRPDACPTDGCGAFSGRVWTFSASIADVDPRDWGGEVPIAPGG